MDPPTAAVSTSWNRLKLGAGILGVTVCVGVAGYVTAGWRLLDAVYMVVITVFGVGYGEVRAVDSDGLRVFTIVLIVAGCSALIYILGGVFQLITEGELNRALGRRRMTKEIGKLDGHVIICGWGRIGRVLGQSLSAAGEPYVVVDNDVDRLESAAAQGASVFEGDATAEATLEAVGVERAKTLATVLPSDALNVFITLTARTLNAELQIVARGEDPTAERKLLQAGANRVVLPAAIGATEMAQIILHPEVGELFDGTAQDTLAQTLRGLGARVFASRVPEGVKRAPTVGDLERDGGGGFLVVAVRTAGGDLHHAPAQGHPLAAGDEVLFLGRSDSAPNLDALFEHYRAAREFTYRGARMPG